MTRMPNAHTGRKLFLVEKTHMRCGSSGPFSEAFANQYQPLMEAAGARLFGIWDASPINARWPAVTTIWEIDSYRHLAQLGAGRLSDPEARQSYRQWLGFLGEIDGSGEGRLTFGNPGIKSVAERQAEGFRAEFVIEEVVTTKPNAQTRYVEELEYLYVPWSEDTGKKWLGSFTTVFRYNEVIHYWACEGGWDVFANHYPSWSDPPDPRIRAWTNAAPAMRDGWEDSFLDALPPNPLGCASTP